MNDKRNIGPEAERPLGPCFTETERAIPTQHRIPRSVERQEFCPKHGRHFSPGFGCWYCEAEQEARPLPGVADEQPAPHGKGVDVATLVRADLMCLDELLGRTDPRSEVVIYKSLLRATVLLRQLIQGDTPYHNIIPHVQTDIEARVESGRQKYGERLTSHNGRNAQLDLYQELLDAILYARQVIHEKENP